MKGVKRVLTAALVAGLPIQAQGIPCVDAPNLAQNIAGNIMDATAWAEEKGMMVTQMDLQSMLSGAEIDAQNNAFANMIARTGLAKQEIQNLEQAERSKPSLNACDSVSMAEAGRQVEQARSERNRERAERRAHETSSIGATSRAMRDGDRTIATARVGSERNRIASEIRERCEMLQSVDASEVDPDAPLGTTLCLHGGLVSGAAADSVYTQDEAEAADVIVELISDPLPENTGSLSGDSPEGNRNMVRHARKEAMKNLVFTSLQEVSSWRQPAAGGISPMMTLEEAVNSHYSADELSVVSNVDPDRKNAEMPSSIQRRIAQINGLGLHIDQERFKSELRREALLASILSLKVTPNEEL